jgi:hypothetical protein
MGPRPCPPKPALLALSAIALIAIALMATGCGGGSSAPAAVDSSGSANAPCSQTFSSLSEVQGAIAKAPSHAVICLEDGDYGKLGLDAGARPTRVIVRAEHPAGATIEGAELAGDDLTLAGFISTEGIQVMPGATGITVEHNRVTGGGEGIEAGPTDTTTVNDTKIIGNQLIGPFGEDAIHLNRYHDSNGDGIGILVEGNEITQVRENGAHSDCLQTVWVGDHIVFRRNYLHDNRCQGFFVKDQASLGGVSGPIHGIKVEDNLFLRTHEPCGKPLDPAECGQPLYFQVAGPYTGFKMKRNTIWGDTVDSIAAFREGTGSDTLIEDNVIYRLWTDTDMSPATLRNNTICELEAAEGGSWPKPTGEKVDCELHFPNTAADDYRLGNGRGVDWAPAEEHYGP